MEMGEIKAKTAILVGEFVRNWLRIRSKTFREYNIRIRLKELGCGDLRWGSDRKLQCGKAAEITFFAPALIVT